MSRKMKSLASWTLMAGFALTPLALQAVVHGEDYEKQVEATMEQFFADEGLVIDTDTEQWFDEDWYTADRFPAQNDSSMFMPDAQMSAAQKAVLLFDYLEGELPHARYRVKFGTDFPYVEDAPATPWAYVEVTRFNLGPAKHEELSQYTDSVAALEEGGAGPPVLGRLGFTAVQGEGAHIEQAATAQAA